MRIKKLQGYIFSREFSGGFVPQRVQNVMIKNYIHMNECDSFLSATEYGLKNCYMILSALSKELACDGVVLYSLFLLPEKASLRKEYLTAFLSRGKEIHFALEGLVISCDKDLQKIEDIFFVKSINNQIKSEFGYLEKLKRLINN